MKVLIHQEEIVIEVKMTREGLEQKELVGQLLIDIARYQEHPGCKSLICFVYDPAGWDRKSCGGDRGHRERRS